MEPFDNADDLFRRVTTEDVQGQLPVHERKMIATEASAAPACEHRAAPAAASGRGTIKWPDAGARGPVRRAGARGSRVAQLPPNHWDVEEVPRALGSDLRLTRRRRWPLPTASGVDVLAEAWQRPAVLAALASRMHKTMFLRSG